MELDPVYCDVVLAHYGEPFHDETRLEFETGVLFDLVFGQPLKDGFVDRRTRNVQHRCVSIAGALPLTRFCFSSEATPASVSGPRCRP
jgi:hypothetical protein